MRRTALGATLLLLAAGCGSSNSSSATCDNLSNAITGLGSKYSACGTLPTITFDKNQCVQAFNNSACTDSDRQKINDFANCLNGLPNCTPATQNAWATNGHTDAAYRCGNGHVQDPTTTRQCPQCGIHDTHLASEVDGIQHFSCLRCGAAFTFPR